MTDDVIARATAALEGVTEGPWRASLLDGIDYEDGSSCIRGGVYPDERGSTPVFLTSGGIDRRDARFIAASRTLVPELLAEVEQLRDHRDAWKENAEHYEWSAGEVGRLKAEVERLRGALDGLADDLAAHNQTTPDDDDHEIICDVESTIACRIRAALRGGQ